MSHSVTPSTTGSDASFDHSLAALVDAATAGDKAAFAALVEQFEHMVRAVALRITRNPEDAADVVQQTWLVLLGKIGSIECGDALPGWLSTTARREAFRIVRARSRNLPLEENTLDHLEDTADSPERQAEKRDLRERVDEALLRLPRRRREFLIDLVGHRMPYAKAAARYEYAPGSLGPLRARYLEQLSAALHELGATAA